MENFGLVEKEILELLRKIYGMTDAGDYWEVTVNRHTQDDLVLLPLLSYLSLYIKRNDEDIDGLLRMFVDDGCLAGNKMMQ